VKDKKLSLTAKTFIGLILGLICGLVLYPIKETPFINDWLINFGFNLVGKVFINAIKLMVVPLVFVSLVVGSSAMGDIKKLGRVGGKIMGLYLITTAAAITLAISLAVLINPGLGLDMSALDKSEYTIKDPVPLVDVFSNMVPTNPIASMANADMLQIIVFAILFGTAMTLVGSRSAKLREFFEEINEVNLKVVEMIMTIAPYGVFCLMAKTFATLGYTAMLPILAYMATIMIGLLLQVCLIYNGLLMGLARLNPITFIKKFWPVMSVAFSTSSSNATLPLNMKTVQEKLGASKEISSFTIPLGATVNMDGTAIMQGVATVFIAQVFGISLGINDYLMVILTATLASIGTAGVPGVGLVMLSMVLQQVGLPVEGIALIIGVDRILDMSRTVINITGDAVCTLIVSKSENEFDEDIYYDRKAYVEEHVA
jgi:Na+/H+-dicarboxylate symporter